MRRVLFSPSIVHHGREHMPVIRYFCRMGWDVHVLPCYESVHSEVFRSACREAGATLHDLPAEFKYIEESSPQAGIKAAAAAPEAGTAIFSLKDLIPGPMRRAFNSAYRVQWVARYCLRLKRFCLSFMAGLKPDMVFLGTFFSIGKIDNGMLYAARSLGIPLFCLPHYPQGYGAKQRLLATQMMYKLGSYKENYRPHSCLHNRILAALFPGWVRENQEGSFFSHDPLLLLGARLAAMPPKRSWEHPSRDFSLVFVELEESRRMLLEDGYPPDKIVVAGKPLTDEVSEKNNDPEYRRKLFQDLGLDHDEPFILVNVDPALEHKYAESAEAHWDQFNGLMTALSRVSMKKVLSLHPICKMENYLFVESEYGYKIARDYKIVELYPHCALVVSPPCSTNYYARMFSKMIFIYDLMNYNYEVHPTLSFLVSFGHIYHTNAEIEKALVENYKEISKIELKEVTIKSSVCEEIYRNATKLLKM